jgi:hypothetical protein
MDIGTKTAKFNRGRAPEFVARVSYHISNSV